MKERTHRGKHYYLHFYMLGIQSLVRLCNVSKVIWLVSDIAGWNPNLCAQNPCPFHYASLVISLKSLDSGFSNSLHRIIILLASQRRNVMVVKPNDVKKYPANFKMPNMYKRVIVILFSYKTFIVFAFSFRSSVHFRLILRVWYEVRAEDIFIPL